MTICGERDPREPAGSTCDEDDQRADGGEEEEPGARRQRRRPPSSIMNRSTIGCPATSRMYVQTRPPNGVTNVAMTEAPNAHADLRARAGFAPQWSSAIATRAPPARGKVPCVFAQNSVITGTNQIPARMHGPRGHAPDDHGEPHAPEELGSERRQHAERDQRATDREERGGLRRSADGSARPVHQDGRDADHGAAQEVEGQSIRRA